MQGDGWRGTGRDPPGHPKGFEREQGGGGSDGVCPRHFARGWDAECGCKLVSWCGWNSEQRGRGRRPAASRRAARPPQSCRSWAEHQGLHRPRGLPMASQPTNWGFSQWHQLLPHPPSCSSSSRAGGGPGGCSIPWGITRSGELCSPGFWSKQRSGQSWVKGDVGKGAYEEEEDNANSLFLREAAFRRKVLCHERSRCSRRSPPVRSPLWLTEPSPARALIVPRDLMSCHGCESKLLWSFHLELHSCCVASWSSSRCRARGSSARVPVPVGAPHTAPPMRLLPVAVGRAVPLEGLPSPSHAVHIASKPGMAGSRHRMGHSGIPSPAGREARRGLCSRQSIISWHHGRLSIVSVGGSGGVWFPCVAGAWPPSGALRGALRWQAAAGGSVIDTATG